MEERTEESAAQRSAARAPERAPDEPVTLTDTVTVTAEKGTRSLQDTATSVVVLGAKALEERGLNDSNEALANIANVTSTGTSNFAPAVRGVDGTGPAQGADAFFAGSRPRLNVQIDGRPVSYNEVVFGGSSLWDVEQIEVLRGPQSTLQGRNAMAGTLAIQTRDPSRDTEAAFRLLGGNQRRRQGAFSVSGPMIGERMSYRLAGDFQASRSFVDFEPFPGVDEPEEFRALNLRGKLMFEPETPGGWRTLVTLQHADAKAPQVVTEKRAFGRHLADYPAMPVFAPRTLSGIVDLQRPFAGRWLFESLVSATDLHVERRAVPRTGIVRLDAEEYVLEPRVRLSRGDGRQSGVAGVYLFRARQDEFIDFPIDERFDDRVDTAALFAEGMIALRHDLDLTLGARYERETHRRRGGEGAAVAIDIDETYEAFLPKLGLAWRPNERWTLGASAARGYNGGGGGITYQFPIVSYSFAPEYVRNYEGYVRGALAEGRVRLTGNLFYGDYHGMQLPFDLNPDPSVWAVVVRNADRARSYGAEVGLRWQALDKLELHGDLGRLETKVTRYPNSNIEGHEFASAPAVTANLSFAWRSARGFELSANARYSDAYFSSIDNHPRGRTDPYWMLGITAGYRRGAVRLFAQVDNVLDSEAPLVITPGATVPEDVATLPRPRSVALGVELNF